MNKQIDKQAETDIPSNYVTVARIRDIRKKMLYGAVNGTPEQRAIAADIWHEDLPDLLETLERTQRGDYKEKPFTLGCLGGIFLAAGGAILGLMGFMGATSAANSELESVKQEAAQRCAEMGGTYANGGAKVGDRTIYCIQRSGVSTVRSN